MPHPSKGRIVMIIAAWVIVQWFVANVLFSLDSSAHVSKVVKLQHGLRASVLMDTSDGEWAVLVTLAMLIIPVIIGIEYLAGGVAWRVSRATRDVDARFPHGQLLMLNWVWLVCLPASVLLGGAGSWLMLLVFPLVAVILGIKACCGVMATTSSTKP